MEEWIGQTIPEHIVDEASEWIARLDMGTHDADLQSAFQIWLDSDPLHKASFEELSLLWAKSSVIKTLSNHVHRSTVVSIRPDSVAPNALQMPNFTDISLSPLLQEKPYSEAISVPNKLYPIAIACITLGLFVPFISSLI